MSAALEVKALSFAYGRQPVLADVAFRVEAGEFFVVIGPNGSGKTTLMKGLAGILKLPPASLQIDGRPLETFSSRELARVVAYVPQSAPDDLPFCVRDVVLMGRAPHLGILGVERALDAERVQAAMAFTGVAHLAERRLNQLSGGERQRVMIARAICQDPRVILLDEPTASLDLAHQVRVMDLMERLSADQGVTVVMVSHDLNLAAMYGDRLLLLQAGRIVRIGTPQSVLTYQALEAVYGCKVLVDRSPLGPFPRITLVPARSLERPPA